MDAQRLDVTLVNRGLSPSRERAQAAITAGMVLVSGTVVTRSARKVGALEPVEVTGDPVGFVGRGGLKLEAALDRFGVSPAGLVCIDVGASTGGFTDCLLRRGAARVYSVDVGHDQLHPSLQTDPRVIVMEGTDIRKLTKLPERPELAVIDVAFISLTLVLPAVLSLLSPTATLISLIKPQFEVGPGRVGKGGIVRDRRVRSEAVDHVLGFAKTIELRSIAIIESPVLGTKGNQEFLALFRRVSA